MKAELRASGTRCTLGSGMRPSWTALVLLIAACCGSPPPRSLAEQVAGSCPTSPSSLKGSQPKGAACASALDCMPTCCTCSGGPKSYLAASCAEGACADRDVACSELLKESNLCG